MKNNNFGMEGWFVRLMMVVCLVVATSGMAAAATVSGTVTNSSTKSGRIYLLVLQQMGGSISSGVSVGPLAPGNSSSYTINGVPDGNYFMFAMLLENQEGGIPHASDPAGMSSNFTVSGGSVSGNTNLTLYNAEPPTFDQKLGAPQVVPSANGVLVEFDKPSNNYGIQLADSFNVYWSTDSTPGSSAGGGMKNVIANDSGPLFLGPASVAPGEDYFFSVAPVVSGVEITSALSDVSEETQVSDQTGGTSISGTVNLSGVSGLSSSTPLYMAAVDDKNGVFVTAIGTPSANQPYTITGVQPGFYSIYAILDMNNSGTFDVGTLINRTNDKSQPVVPVPPNAPASLLAADITMVPKSALVKVTTTHSRSNSSDYYSLGFEIESVNRQVVNVRLGSGPQVSGPIDLSASTSGGFGYWTQVSARPVVGDSYPVTVYYASGNPASEVINAVVTAVLDNFANAAYPPPSGTVPSGQFPNFAWRQPTPVGYFTYQASIDNNGGGGDSKALPFYSLSGKNQTNLNDGYYNWNLTVQDDFGNQARLQNSFTVVSPSTPLSISGFTPTGYVGGSAITINGNGFDSTLAANNSVSFNGTPSVPAATVNGAGTQLTVNVPNNTPLSGPLSVTVNGVRAVSDGEFTGTIKAEGFVQDKNSTGPISGATATLVENPAVTASANGTNGQFSFPKSAGIPSGRFYSLRYSTAGVGGYLDTYSHIMSNGTDVTVVLGNNTTNNLFKDSDLSFWGLTRTPGKGVIRTKVQNMDTGTPVDLAGAVVTATSKMHPDIPYTVKYTDGTAQISTGTATNSNGMFYVLDVDEGDYVTLTASMSGKAFNPRIFATHGNAVHQGSVRGASTATSTASLPSGNYSGLQSVTLSILPPATAANFDIIYTTNGNDPTNGGITYSAPIPISSTTTLKFFAKNNASGAGFAVETPYNTRVYNFDGKITGTVTAANGGAAIPNIPVQLFDAYGNPMQGTSTDSSGNYTLGGMTTGNYKVCFYSGSTGYIPQCYNNKPDTASADTIAVTTPNTVSSINAVLVQGGIITGHVTSNGSSGIQNVWIGLNDTNGNQVPGINGGNTDQNGFYTLRGIPTGTYKIYFGGQNTSYISQWYNNKTDSTSADPFPVVAGATYNNVDAQLALGGSISGQITNGATGIQNVSVQVRDTNGNWIPNLNSTGTDSNGNYTLGGLPTGSYKIYFDGMSSGYISEWYDNAADQSTAAILAVTAGGSLTGKNAVLAQGGTITGTVTNGSGGIGGVMVQLRDTSGNWIPNFFGAMTNPDGTYTMGGIPLGSYKLYFDGQSTGYIGQWYNNVADQSFATVQVIAAPGALLPGRNAILVQGASISGTVTNGTSGIQDISVQLYNSSGMQTLFNTNTNPSGSYQFTGLQAGTYRVCFSPGQTNYIAKCYNNLAYNSNTATDITVSVPGGRNDINATMTQGGGISGQVTNGSSGIPNISVEVRDTLTGNSIPGVFGMWTDFNGNYNILGVPAGNIKVYFNPNGASYAGQWYNNKASFASSDNVAIFAGLTTSPVNAVLQPATAPGAPTIDSIIPGNGFAQVNFTAPTSDGGMPIQDYTVTVNPGGMTGFNFGSPIYVYGLTNGQNYTVSVTARNNLGNSTAASTPYSLPLFTNTGNDLQAAVSAVAANGVIWAQGPTAKLDFPPLLITKGVTISGGYSFDYSTVNGYSTITGRVNITGSGFKAIFKNVKVKAP